MHVIKFSNGLYLINALCSYGEDSIDYIFTANLNKARLFDGPGSAQRMAERVLADLSYTAVTDCTYDVVAVRIIED